MLSVMKSNHSVRVKALGNLGGTGGGGVELHYPKRFT